LRELRQRQGTETSSGAHRNVHTVTFPQKTTQAPGWISALHA
jgi:hypothetical protein